MNSFSSHSDPLMVVVMGVSGCGKSTIARKLANALNAHFKDADELHPSSNIEKMKSGLPLSDDDRIPWLEDIAQYAREYSTRLGICVIACSALKVTYREILNTSGRVVYVYLNGTFELIMSRLKARSGHFMPEALLQSQFDTLEDPTQEANALTPKQREQRTNL